MTKTEPRSAGSGGGRDKTQPTSTELLALGEEVKKSLAEAIDTFKGTPRLEKFLMIERYINALTTLSAREDGWRPMDTLPRDATVLVVTEATAANTTYGDGGHRNVYPAYIDEDGAVCDGGNSGHPDPGIKAGFWRAVLWQPLPPAPKAPTAGEGDDETLWTVYKTMLHWVPFVGREAAILKVREAISQPKASAEGEPT